jgi:peptidoglycan/LPS O-acetylase OafA/YrhL
VLRFVAFLLVFLHHVFRDPSETHVLHTVAADVTSSIANACGFGLCLFYFLSSYLIATLLLIELNETHGIMSGSFISGAL